ncbi:MAG: 4-hydroxy-3-methylbut-2-enyl diphosphate reductase [Desulfobacteraceae bacterium 4572_130]|nr:MAG: 4-hydroxy-3-methylbut-2-enyl diphosphate reductase [Desulfobacteraceae bacterium 4572_130]
MKISIAKNAGFCMGVQRAVNIALDASNNTKEPLYTFGPLIHNPQVLEMLKNKGILSLQKIPEKGKGTVLIRAHGVPLNEHELLEKVGFNVINATCPRVISVQKIIKKHGKAGYETIIIGDRNHPEVKGLLGYVSKNGYTVSSLKEFKNLPKFEKAVVVAQTTQDTSLFNQIKKNTQNNYPKYKIFNTICDSTEKRQKEVREISEKNDVIIVIGGKQSGNTRRLAQIAASTGKSCFHIENISELDFKKISFKDSLAITAGASTPNWIINEAYGKIKTFFQKNNNLFYSFVLQTRDFLLKTNILLSLGAGCLTYACSRMQGFEHNLPYVFLAMFYILSMQIINNLFTIKSDKYNNPKRAYFYEKNKKILRICAGISGLGGLYITFHLSIFSFFIFMAMSILGFSYNLKFFSFFKIKRRIKDISGSKTIFIAGAWGIITSVLPFLLHQSSIFNFQFLNLKPQTLMDFISVSPFLLFSRQTLAMVSVFVFSTGLVFSRTIFFDILEMQGNRITGKETLAILIGEKKSLKIIKQVLILIFLVCFLSASIGIIQKTGFVLAFLPVLMLFLIIYTEKNNLFSGMYLYFIIELHFIIAGIMAVIF